MDDAPNNKIVAITKVGSIKVVTEHRRSSAAIEDPGYYYETTVWKGSEIMHQCVCGHTHGAWIQHKGFTGQFIKHEDLENTNQSLYKV